MAQFITNLTSTDAVRPRKENPMELLAGILIGALMGSAAAAMMRVGSSRGIYLHAMLGVVGAGIGGAATVRSELDALQGA